jgi:hypothetical protein
MTPEESYEKHLESMERIWDIVKTWDYKTYKSMQELLAPVED